MKLLCLSAVAMAVAMVVARVVLHPSHMTSMQNLAVVNVVSNLFTLKMLSKCFFIKMFFFSTIIRETFDMFLFCSQSET